jgi:ribosome-binding protein aMBF1 (putative translation factor)
VSEHYRRRSRLTSVPADPVEEPEPADWPEWLSLVGGRIAAGRARRGLRLEALAKQSGIELETVSGVESARLTNLDLMHLWRIAAVLRVRLVDLVAAPGGSVLDGSTNRPSGEG